MKAMTFGEAIRLFVPGVTGGFDDVVAGFEDPIRQPIGAQKLPDVFDRVQFRRARWQEDQGHVFRGVELVGLNRAGPQHPSRTNRK